MKKFTIGALSGIAAITLAVPVFAQVSSSVNNAGNRSAQRIQGQFQAPTQECISALAAKEELHLENFDAINAVRKSSAQAHLAALKTAASITDDTQRQEALQKAREDMRVAMEATMEPYADEMETIMKNVRDTCGYGKGMRGGHMGGMMKGGFDGQIMGGQKGKSVGVRGMMKQSGAPAANNR